MYIVIHSWKLFYFIDHCPTSDVPCYSQLETVLLHRSLSNFRCTLLYIVGNCSTSILVVGMCSMTISLDGNCSILPKTLQNKVQLQFFSSFFQQNKVQPIKCVEQSTTKMQNIIHLPKQNKIQLKKQNKVRSPKKKWTKVISPGDLI